MELITTQGLCKTFQSGKATVEAVKQVNLKVRQGEIYGFLGPNGAGKTTTMRMLTTLMPPSSGKAAIVGFDLAKQPKKIREKIGYVSQKGGCYEFATGFENMVLQGRLYGLSRAAAKQKAEALIRSFHMEEYARRKVITYSGGQRRHVDLAMGIMHDPQLLFLDEPTTGLDPTSRANFWNEIKNLKAQGMTVFLTTHYLDEADQLCDTICIMDHGEIAAEGTALELKRRIAGDIIEIGVGSEQIAAARALLRQREDVLEQSEEDGGILKLYVREGEKALPGILPALVEAQIPVRTIEMSRPSLDEVFLKATGHALSSPKDKEGVL